jgi:hypothetical protein
MFNENTFYENMEKIRGGNKTSSMRIFCTRELGGQVDHVGFVVLCNRHWFNRVPGSNLSIACLPFTVLTRICGSGNGAATGATTTESMNKETTDCMLTRMRLDMQLPRDPLNHLVTYSPNHGQ